MRLKPIFQGDNPPQQQKKTTNQKNKPRIDEIFFREKLKLRASDRNLLIEKGLMSVESIWGSDEFEEKTPHY